MNVSSPNRFDDAISNAIRVVELVPKFATAAERLRQLSIAYVPTLPDRAQTTLTGSILIGPEAIAASSISLAGTLVHEAYHTHQSPLEKTTSMWSAILKNLTPGRGRTHLMARYERPAYREQVAFLSELAAVRPELAAIALAEVDAVRASVYLYYGPSVIGP